MTIEEAIAQVKKWHKAEARAYEWPGLYAFQLILDEVERLRGEVATLKARLDYPPAAGGTP